MMNDYKLKAFLLDNGVAEGEDTIVINGNSDHCYIHVVSNSGYLKVFYYQNNKLCHIGGNCTTPEDVDLMREVDLENYEV